jgi:hypothetical protein
LSEDGPGLIPSLSKGNDGEAANRYFPALCTNYQNEGLRSSLTHSNAKAGDETIGIKMLTVVGRFEGGDRTFGQAHF